MSLRAIATAGTGSANSTTLVLTLPASTQAGDVVLIAALGSPTSGAVSSVGDTVTVVVPSTTYLSAGSQTVWQINAGASTHGSTVTITGTVSGRMAAIAWVAQLVTTTLDGNSPQGGGNNVTAIPIPSVTPLTGHTSDRLVIFYGGRDVANASANPLSAPAGFTQRGQADSASTASPNAHVAAADKQLTTASATGTFSATATIGLVPAMATAILLVPTDAPPTANAGPAQSVGPGVTVTLDGTGSSDPEGAVTYAWSQTGGTAVTLSSSTVAQPTFTAPADVNGQTLTFQLTVTDTASQTGTATVVITVDPAPYLYRHQAGAWVRRKLWRRVSGAWVWP